MSKRHILADNLSLPTDFCNSGKTPLLTYKDQSIYRWKPEKKHENIKIDEEARNASLKQLWKIKLDFARYKSKIIQEELSLIKQIQKEAQIALEDLKLQEQYLNECVLEVCTLKEIDISKEITFIEFIFTLSPTDLSKILKSPKLCIYHLNPDDISNMFELEELWNGTNHKMKYIKNQLSFKQFLVLFSLLFSSSLFAYIRSYRPGDFFIFDAKASKIKKRNLPNEINKKINQDGAKCLLPDGSLFYYDGYTAVIISAECYKIKYIPSCKQKILSAGAIYKDGEIYIFGGSENASAKFSIAKNKWTSLTNAQWIGKYTFAAIFKNLILLGSFDTEEIIYYDATIDCFNTISSVKLCDISCKVIFVENEIVYLIELYKAFNNIFKSIDHLTTWDKIGSTLIPAADGNIIGPPITYDQKVYFVTDCEIYLFDLKKEKIEIVTLFPCPYFKI